MKQIALVTGANRGIGQAIAIGLAAKGIHVVLGARDAATAMPTLEAVQKNGGTAEIQQLDVVKNEDRTSAIETILGRHGQLDIVVNNAGIAIDKWVKTAELPLQILRETMEVNLYAPLHLCQLALPAMQEKGFGRIVNVSSELGSLSRCEMGSTAAYRMSKTALNMLTRLLACEVGEQTDIQINAAAPGWVRTELGGDDAPLTPDQGADTAIWLATQPRGGPRGGFFRERQPYPW